jgi:hypothetical protein
MIVIDSKNYRKFVGITRDRCMQHLQQAILEASKFDFPIEIVIADRRPPQNA